MARKHHDRPPKLRRYVFLSWAEGYPRKLAGRRLRQVFFAWDRKRRRRVVVKCYRDRRLAEREREVLRALPRDPHFVRLRGYFRHRGTDVIVMECAEGPTLQGLVKQKGALEPAYAVAIALDLLAALRCLHRAGFVHGDLHDENVIVVSAVRGRVKLVDYQHMARLGANGRGRARRTIRRPSVKLPPESVQRRIDARFDLYGVGYLCAYMLLGRRPTTRQPRGDNEEGPLGHLWAVIRKAMRPRPEERFPSATEMSTALGPSLRDFTSPARKFVPN